MFQIAVVALLTLATLVGALLLRSQPIAAQGFLDFSLIENYLPDSLRKIYSAPILADYDVLFGIDSTGKPLYLNVASNKTRSVMVVVDPARGKDSALLWVSEPLAGRVNRFYATDINGDNYEEIVVSCRTFSDRKTGVAGWHRVHIWRWPLDGNPDSVLTLAPCSDTLHPYFQALTRVDIVDTGAKPDGVSEIVAISNGNRGGLLHRDSIETRTVYYWTGEEYCVKR